MKGRPAETLLDNRDLTNLMDAAVVQVSKPVSFLLTAIKSLWYLPGQE